MARYYKPAQGRIRDGGIFQPDWELAQKAFLQKDSDMGDVIDTLSILDTPVIDYNRQADQGYADEVEAAMQGQIDDVARGIMEDVGNASKNKRALATLKKDFEKSAESGDLYKLSSHRQAIDDWQKKVGGLKNISEQQKYGNYLNKYYQDAGGMGAKDNPFNSIGVVSQDGTSFSDFIGSDFYKALVADETGREWTNTNGVKMMKINNKLVELTPQRIAEAYQGWLNDNPDALLRAQIGEEYLGEEGQWLDEGGQLGAFTMEDVLDDEGKVVDRQIAPTNTIQGRSLAQGLLSVPYKKDYKSEVFQRYELQYEKNLEFNNYKRKQEYLDPKGFLSEVDVQGYDEDKRTEAASKKYLSDTKSKMVQNMINGLPEAKTEEEKEANQLAIDNYTNALNDKFSSLKSLNQYARDLKLPNLIAETEFALDMSSNKFGWNKIDKAMTAKGETLTAPQKKALIKNTNENAKTQVENGRAKLMFNQRYHFNHVNKNTGEVETFKLEEMMNTYPDGTFDANSAIGSVIFDPQSQQKVRVTKVHYEEDSFNPNIRNAPWLNGKPLSDNSALMSIQFEVEPVSGAKFGVELDRISLGVTHDMNQKDGGISFPDAIK